MSGAARRLLVIAVVAAVLVVSGCLSVGRDFPAEPVSQIQLGVTSQGDLRRMFGSPFRIGVENGEATWTYGHYHYSLFGSTTTRDLVLRFDARGIVTSYSYNATAPDDA